MQTAREIKFRAWQPHRSLHRKPGMYIVESIEWYRLPHEGHIGEAFLTPPGEDAMSSEYLEDIKLMQYTGLKSKSDQDIYEGDILRGEFGVDDKPVELREYHLEGGGTAICYMYSLSPLNQGLIDECDIEVVGNIHEHPELLEEER